MRSFILITDNSEEWVQDILNELVPLNTEDELIIYDNQSTDNTVPIIVSMIGILWACPNNKYQFYIGTKKKSIEEIKEKLVKHARYSPFFLERGDKNVKNK